MNSASSIWLVTNASSGSNDDDSVDRLKDCCAEHGVDVQRTIAFPDEELPTSDELDAAGIRVVGVFAGDGTINALITSLYGWGGAVLVLEGGTMNLLYHRLHGDAEQAEVIAALAAGETAAIRPGMIRSSHGDSLAGLLAGPGTSWNDVREAMREVDIAGLADGAASAIEESTNGPMVACVEPALGRAEGYPLVMLTPGNEGFEVRGYHSETTGDYLNQAFALLRRNFREGPHDLLGKVDRLRIASVEGQPIGLSVDGEQRKGAAEEIFTVAPCEVDLLTTLPHVE